MTKIPSFTLINFSIDLRMYPWMHWMVNDNINFMYLLALLLSLRVSRQNYSFFFFLGGGGTGS